MDDHHIEESPTRLIQEVLEHRPSGNGLVVSGLTFLTVDPDRFPPPVLAELTEQPLLGVQGVAIDLTHA
jgi:hypothetical protein